MEVGKDFRHGNWVFGLYGNVDVGNQTGTFSTEHKNYATSEHTTAKANLTLGTSAAITGRIGVLANERTLLYGLAGYTWRQYDASVQSHSDYCCLGPLR